MNGFVFQMFFVRLDLENFFAEMKEVQATDCKLLFVVFRYEC